MKIRSKLLMIYGVMLALLLLVGIFSLASVLDLRNAADELSEINDQSIRAEKLRADTQRQISYALDYMLGDRGAEEVFEEIQENTRLLVGELNNNSHSPTESDLINNLEETQYELVWLMKRYFDIGQQNLSESNLPEARAHLREIGDEVADDVATLNKYYSRQQSDQLAATSGASRTIVLVVAATAALAFIQFMALVMLSQRWLVRPIGDLNRTAAAIARGELDTHIEFPGKNEWGQLADSINRMTASLKETLQKLGAHERSAAMVEIAAYASHNIRNPLAGIRAAAQVIIDYSGSADPETIESLREIIDTIDRLDNWLKRLLEYAKPLHPEIEPVDINRLIRESVDVTARSYPGRNIRLEWLLSGGVPKLMVDSILIEQMLTAIISNSYESIENGGEITIETGLITQDDGRGAVEIRISDTGKGIPERIQPNLFRAFMTGKDGGTGLGLAQAKKIIDIHGGGINLESSPGKGTTVKIRLPVLTETE